MSKPPRTLKVNPKRGRNKKTEPENQLHDQFKEAGINGYKRNARFIPKRKYEADFWFADLRLAVEVDGGIYMAKGGHTSGPGYQRDRERDQLALLNGIVTARVTSNDVYAGDAIAFLKNYLPLRRQEVGPALVGEAS